MPHESHIATQNIGYHKRYVYYGSPTEFSGTAYCELSNNDMNVKRFYYNSTIDEALRSATSSDAHIVFWVLWILLIAILVYAFVIRDNKWCEG